MTFEVTVHYDDAFLKLTTRRVCSRLFSLKLLFWLGVLLASDIAFFVLGDSVAGLVIACAWVVVIVLLVATYFFALGQARRRLARMPTRISHFSFADDYIAVKTDLGESKVVWKVVTKLWTFSDVWIFF